MSYGPVRQRLQGAGPAFLPQIQTAADFAKTKNIYIRVNERNKGREERAMMNRIHKTAQNRIYTDPRINLMGERVDRVWADPILNPRKGVDR